MKKTRHDSRTQKIEREVTGLAGALFVHVSFTESGAVDSVWFSHKQKDNSTMDKMLTALGEAVTSIIRDDNGTA